MLYLAIDLETGESKWFMNIRDFDLFKEENINTHNFFEVKAFPVD